MEKDLSRLVLIDGNAILHRAYHALPRLTGRGGAPINAVYGFCSILLKVIDDLNPAFLAVAFDTPAPTFRQAEFVGYQAQRPKMEAELAGQIDKVKEVLGAMGVAIFEKPGFEADDVLGTIVAKMQSSKPACRQGRDAEKQRIESIIVSGDRDLMQLVDKNTKMYLPTMGVSEAVIVDEEGVKEKLGVSPAQVVDYKGLVGDSSDNYPGVPGIGPKTAVELLERYGSLEGIYEGIGGIKDKKVKEKLTAGRESAVLSKRLAQIATEVPLTVDWEKMKLEKEKILPVLAKVGFKSLVERVKRGGNEEGGGDEGGIQGRLF